VLYLLVAAGDLVQVNVVPPSLARFLISRAAAARLAGRSERMKPHEHPAAAAAPVLGAPWPHVTLRHRNAGRKNAPHPAK